MYQLSALFYITILYYSYITAQPAPFHRLLLFPEFW